jgi:hypothetical protein
LHKYASEDAANAAEQMSFREEGRKKAAVVVELVGKDREVERMAKTSHLEEVTLPQALISHAGDTEWIKEHAAGITSLALDENLFSEWEAVATLTCHLPKLTTLALNGNKFTPLLQTPSQDVFRTAFSCLKKLALNATGANLQQVGLVKSFLPQLTHLHVASNRIASIAGDACSFEGWPSLHLLDLTDNEVASWSEIMHLAAFSKLQRLILSGNRLDSVRLPADQPSPFPELILLAVANNKIADWASMEALASLPALTELRVQVSRMPHPLSPPHPRRRSILQHASRRPCVCVCGCVCVCVSSVCVRMHACRSVYVFVCACMSVSVSVSA